MASATTYSKWRRVQAWFRRYLWAIFAGAIAVLFLLLRILTLNKAGKRPELPADLPAEAIPKDLRTYAEKKVQAAVVDHKIELERSKAKTEEQRKQLDDIAQDTDHRRRSEKMADWLGQNI